MGRLNKLWNRSSQEIKAMVLEFPFSVATTVILTLIYVVYDGNLPFMEYGILPFLSFICMGSFLGESLRCEKKYGKWIGLAGTWVASAVLAYFLYATRSEAYGSDFWLQRCVLAYIAITLIIGIYNCYRRSDQTFPQYVIKVFSNLLKTHIAFFILFIGVLVISEIIQILFFEEYFYRLTENLLIMLVGFYYVPSWIYAVSRVEAETEKFAKILVRFVLLPLSIVLFAIIYAYIGKILLMQEMPSNQIFIIVTSLFLLAMPTWTMMESFGKELKLPIFFMPLILLQIYAIVVRILEFGMTPTRYMGLLWIILEIIYLVIYYVKRKNCGILLWIGTVAIVFALITPGINMYSISIFSQENILAQYHEQEELSDELKEKIYGAYAYLSDMTNSVSYIEEKYTAEEIAEIKDFYDGYWHYDQSEMMYIFNVNTKPEMNIEGYHTMTHVNYYTKYDTGVDLQNLEFYIYGTEDVEIILNLQKELDGYVEYGLSRYEGDYALDISSYYMDHCEMELDEGGKLLIQDIGITFKKDTKTIEELDINGYLLK